MGDGNTPPQAPIVVPFGGPADIDQILARFPGPVAITVGGTLLTTWLDQTRPIGGIGCGLFIGAVTTPLIALLIEVGLGGSREAVLVAAAAIGVGLAVMLSRGRWPRNRYLFLDRDGFAVRNGRIVPGGRWEVQSGRWQDVSDFRLAGVVRFPRIRFKNSASTARHRVLVGLGEDTLKFLIPYRDAALASLLNQWRERAFDRTNAA